MTKKQQDKLLKVARRSKWKVQSVDYESIVLVKPRRRLEIIPHRYKYTVISFLPHPRKGNTRLVRNDLDFARVRSIIMNPRMHTPKKISTYYL